MKVRGGKLATHIVREPLVHFLLIGAALFLLFSLGQEQGGDTSRQIIVDTGQVEQLAAQFERTFLRQPTEQELAALIDGHVREEVFYREALAMGLDRNDPQVRKRMRLKLEFLLEDLIEQAPPSDETLSDYLARQEAKFRVEPRISFLQIYLSPDKHGNIAEVAKGLLAQLRSGADPSGLGDRTLAPHRLDLTSSSDIARYFGEPFAKKLELLETGVWVGPHASGLGWHLVLVTERIESRTPELAEIRPQVEREYLVERRQESKDQTYSQLLKNYEVIINPSGGRGDKTFASTPAQEKGQ